MLAGTSASYEEAVVGADGLFGGSFSQRSSPHLVPSPAGTFAPREQMIGTALEVISNDERSVIYAQRPVILIGIADIVLRGDLRDRSVFLQMTAIPDSSPGCIGEALWAMRLDFVPRTAVDVQSQPQVEIGRGCPEKTEDPAVSDQTHHTQPEGVCRACDCG